MNATRPMCYLDCALLLPDMVYRKISEDIKNRVLFLLDSGDLPDEYDVAEIFGVSERSIQRWRSNLEHARMGNWKKK